jgi:hypothetical protein
MDTLQLVPCPLFPVVGRARDFAILFVREQSKMNEL